MALNYKSLKNLVYEHLYKSINNGHLKPGEKINENQLCKDLQVSRTPIREALIQLENEGYIHRLNRRGFVVREISQEKIREIYQIIGCLEGLAASLAVGNLSDDDFNFLRDLIAKMDLSIEKRKIREYFAQQRSFHDVYIAASRNEELFNLITSLKKRFIKKAYFMHENEDFLYKNLKRNNNEHKQILKMLEEGDKAGVNRFLVDVHWNYDYANIVISTFMSSNNK